MSDTVRDVRKLAGDPVTLEAFYREHVGEVRRFIARRTDDPYLAADLTADVFMTAIATCAAYDAAKGSEIGWLVGICKNVIRGDQRKRARELRAMTRVVGSELMAADAIERATEIIDSQRAARDFSTALASLPPREREVFELVAVDGLTVTEAAQALSLKPGTARVRLHRARARVMATVQSNPMMAEEH